MQIMDAELLKYAVDNGIIDTNIVQKQIDMNRRKEIIKNHPYRIWEGKNGKWYTYIDEYIRKKVLKKRNSERKIEDLIVDEFNKSNQEPRIENVFSDWVTEKLELKEICKGTYDRYWQDFNRFFTDKPISNIGFSKITEEALELFIRSSIVEHNLTTKGFSNLRTLILGIFKYAKKKKVTKISITNFMGDLNLSRKSFKRVIKDKKEQVYMKNEVVIMTQYLRSNPTIENLGLLLTFQTGVRRGELAALKREDIIDYKNKIIHIRRTEIKFKDENGRTTHEVRDFPKSDAGYRYLIITNNAVDTIDKILELNPAGEYLFEKNGKRILSGSFGRQITINCKMLGMSNKSMQKIRRTYGTTLIDADVDESLIVNQMGHSDIAVTKEYYYYSNKCEEDNKKQISSAILI